MCLALGWMAQAGLKAQMRPFGEPYRGDVGLVSSQPKAEAA